MGYLEREQSLLQTGAHSKHDQNGKGKAKALESLGWRHPNLGRGVGQAMNAVFKQINEGLPSKGG